MSDTEKPHILQAFLQRFGDFSFTDSCLNFRGTILRGKIGVIDGITKSPMRPSNKTFLFLNHRTV